MSAETTLPIEPQPDAMKTPPASPSIPSNPPGPLQPNPPVYNA